MTDFTDHAAACRGIDRHVIVVGGAARHCHREHYIEQRRTTWRIEKRSTCTNRHADATSSGRYGAIGINCGGGGWCGQTHVIASAAIPLVEG